MTTVREGIEQAVLVSIGAASLTRERAEARRRELVRKGQLGGEEGRAVVDRLMARVRGEAPPPGGRLIGRVEGGVQRRAARVRGGHARRARGRAPALMALEHRIKLLETAPPGRRRPERRRDVGPDRGPAPRPASAGTLARMARGERRQNLARLGRSPRSRRGTASATPSGAPVSPTGRPGRRGRRGGQRPQPRAAGCGRCWTSWARPSSSSASSSRPVPTSCRRTSWPSCAACRTTPSPEPFERIRRVVEAGARAHDRAGLRGVRRGADRRGLHRPGAPARGCPAARRWWSRSSAPTPSARSTADIQLLYQAARVARDRVSRLPVHRPGGDGRRVRAHACAASSTTASRPATPRSSAVTSPATTTVSRAPHLLALHHRAGAHDGAGRGHGARPPRPRRAGRPRTAGSWRTGSPRPG